MDITHDPLGIKFCAFPPFLILLEQTEIFFDDFFFRSRVFPPISISGAVANPESPEVLTDALQGEVGPAGLRAIQDALDEAGGASFAFVAGFAGVAQQRVQLRATAGLDLGVGHGLGGTAASWDGAKKNTESYQGRQSSSGSSSLGQGGWRKVSPKFPSKLNFSMILENPAWGGCGDSSIL